MHHSKTIFKFILLALSMPLTSCAWLSGALQGSYYEDLAKHRSFPKTAPEKQEDSIKPFNRPGPPLTGISQVVTEQLDDLLEARKKINQQATHIPGFTIQVYTGESRKEAFRVRNKLYQYYSHLEPKISYHSTNYTVSVGEFLDQLEAYKVYILLKKRLSSAIIRPIALPNKRHTFSRKPTQENPSEPLAPNESNE